MKTLESLRSRSVDVAVIGGGPAGATTAALLAENGLRVVVFEREAVPRFHVGESLVPATYWSLQRLGLVDRLKESAFPKKFSVQFVTEEGKETKPFYFDKFKDHESSQTWQVWRDDFDRMLLECSVERGAEVITDAQVTEVLFEDEKAVGVRVRSNTPGGQDLVEVRADVVVDASGLSAFLANRLKIKEPDPRLQKGTIWGYFENARRDSGRDEGATIILQTKDKRSWFWYIPLRDNVVSVGCTGSLNYMFQPGGGDVSDVWAREVARCPAIQQRLAEAELKENLRTTRDFSYKATKAAGPGWVLVGDAVGFIDPVYSTGVFLAMKSGEMAADAVVNALGAGDVSGERLGAWKGEFDEGGMHFQKLVYAFYTPGFSFGSLLRENPHCIEHMANILMGNVWEPNVGELFDVMGEVVPPRDDDPAMRLAVGEEA
ncbi:MAG TPA: NAD(P)/FAD-dependent oxidoreductase [Planctomycetaceae bacterium]|nr:NAD(P)/FAD-dependent oxidoreductase [Planctomycetaceae bacterium]